MTQFIDSRANLTLIRLMVDPQSPECALHDSDISLTNAVYYDVFRVITQTQNSSNDNRISRADLRRQVKNVSKYVLSNGSPVSS